MGGNDSREDETDRVKMTMERRDGGERWDEGAKGNKRCVRRGAFFFGPWWSSHRVITQDEEAYMSNLYSARSSVSKFEST